MALLDITTERPRETIKIDGQEYQLAAYDDFSITDQKQLEQVGKRFNDLAGKLLDDDDAVGEAAAQVVDADIEAVFLRAAGDIPPEIHQKLTHFQKQQVVQAYFLAYARLQETRQKEVSQNGRQPNSRRSPGSTKASRRKSG